VGVNHLPLPISLVCCVLVFFATSADAATRTFKPGGVNGFFSVPANWEEGIAPVDGDDLILSYAPVTPIVNDILNLHVKSFTVIGQYNLSGQPLFLGEGGFRQAVMGGVGILWMDLPVTLEADQTWDTTGIIVHVNGELRLAGRTLTIEPTLLSPGTVVVNGVISGVGRLVQNGQGRIVLANANTYTGQTIVNRGEVVVSHPNGLGVGDGTLANGTIVNDGTPWGGTLMITADPLGNEYIRASGRGWMDQGALSTVTFPTLTGPVELVGDVRVLGLTTSGLKFAGPVLGNGRLVLADFGFYELRNAANTFTGGVKFGDATFASPTLIVSAPDAVPGVHAFDLKNNAKLQVNANGLIIDSLIGSDQGAGVMFGPQGVLYLNGTGEAVYSGLFSGTGVILLNGSLHQTFTNPNSIFDGNLFIWKGTVTLTSPFPAVRAQVELNGRLSLRGNGSVKGGVLVLFGTLMVSEGGAATGAVGPLEMRPESTFEVGGSMPAALGKLTVNGTVDLKSNTLKLALPEGFSPTLGQAFTILDNDAAEPIKGTFAGLPEGATFTSRGVTFGVSYTGGSGNDVTLTVTDIAREYFLSEGATGTFFNTDILIANPNLTAAPITITFLKSDGTPVVLSDNLPARSHRTLNVNDVAGMNATAFSTIVKSDTALPLVVERTMSWDTTGYASHTEHAVDGPSKTWYFAEGSQGFFSTYVLLANPQTTANSATVRYLLEGSAPILRTYPLDPSSRFTIDIGADAELVNRSFGMDVTFDQPGIAERAMYFGSSPLWKAGHESAGVTAPSTQWFLAEGATGGFFETFVLLANPNDQPVTATLTFLPATGVPVVKTKLIPKGRVTVNIEAEDPSLASVAVATGVTAPLPIIVERSQYWPDPAPQWYEAHNSFGVTATGTKWGLAEGRVGGSNNAQTYILLANPGAAQAQVEIMFLRESGAPVVKNFTVEPGTRFNVAVGADAPELDDENFGAVISSTQPIVVERALYWDAGGVTWAAGSNATATRLP
jgi:autotransporter-associated beta strand protein